MDNRFPRIGIVTGAGPMAGALLFGKVIAACQQVYGCQNDDEFPWILMLSIPFADMLTDAERQRAKVEAQLQEALETLAANQAEMGIIACQTLHAFLSSIQELPLPVAHLINETASALPNGKETVVLCTSTSASQRIHERSFPCLYPEPEIQEQVDRLIVETMRGEEDPKRVEALCSALNRCFAGSSYSLVLGCTELSLVNEASPFSMHGLDSRLSILLI